jgi:hypothetical protein
MRYAMLLLLTLSSLIGPCLQAATKVFDGGPTVSGGTPGGGGGDCGEAEGGCSTGSNAGIVWLALLALLCGNALRSRVA